jgi:hypothetical protein
MLAYKSLIVLEVVIYSGKCSFTRLCFEPLIVELVVH